MPSGPKKQNRKQKQYCNKFNKDQKKKKKSISKVFKKTAGKTEIPPPSPHSEATGISYWGLFCPPSMRSPGAGSPPGSSPGCGLASVPSAPTEVEVPRAASASACHMGHSLRVQSPKPSLGDSSGPSPSLPLTFSAIQIPAMGISGGRSGRKKCRTGDSVLGDS